MIFMKKQYYQRIQASLYRKDYLFNPSPSRHFGPEPSKERQSCPQNTFPGPIQIRIQATVYIMYPLYRSHICGPILIKFVRNMQQIYILDEFVEQQNWITLLLGFRYFVFKNFNFVSKLDPTFLFLSQVEKIFRKMLNPSPSFSSSGSFQILKNPIVAKHSTLFLKRFTVSNLVTQF